MPRPKGLPKTGGRAKGVLNKGNPKRVIVAELLQAAPKGTLEEFREYFGPKMPSIFKVLEAVAQKGDVNAVRLLFDRQYGPAATQSVKVSSENESGRFVIEVETTPPSQE